jgi:hypothetical protein
MKKRRSAEEIIIQDKIVRREAEEEDQGESVCFCFFLERASERERLRAGEGRNGRKVCVSSRENRKGSSGGFRFMMKTEV